MLYKPDNLKQITWWTDIEFKKDLQRLAVQERMTLSSLIRTAIVEYMQKHIMPGVEK